MVKKSEKKELLRKQIIECAKIYSDKLSGKDFIYIYGEKFFEIRFTTERFLHLTGVESELSAKDFYKKAKKSILTSNQFHFSNEHPFANAKKKLPCLFRLPELTESMVCVVKEVPTLSFTYKIGITNLEFTLGISKINNGKGEEKYYFPRSLRVNDKSVEKSREGEVVDFIFSKDASLAKYNILLCRDEHKRLPRKFAGMIEDNISLS